MILNDRFVLANGVAVPKLGLGTWCIDDGAVAQVVRDAAAIGYRHFDTAQAYGNERGVGEGQRLLAAAARPGICRTSPSSRPPPCRQSSRPAPRAII
jgi:diketogulonate reductase-like aldo/keto reductase